MDMDINDNVNMLWIPDNITFCPIDNKMLHTKGRTQAIYNDPNH